MCGFAGVLGDRSRVDASQVSKSLQHRGPDGEGCWSDADVLLVHRRLAVVGLDAGGAQPAVSKSGRFVLLFNGEIYNHRRIREQSLAAWEWIGASDTETLLVALEKLGVRACVDLLVGMFAFALWDRQERCLTLVRDRIGEKPLYVAELPDRIVFASEMSALQLAAGQSLRLRSSGLLHLLELGSERRGGTMLENVHTVPSGAFITISWDDRSAYETRYWTSSPRVRGRANQNRTIRDTEAIRTVDATLAGTVRDQMIADVPVGAFLSGGIDSTLIVAKMMEVSSTPVRTYSIGFDAPTHNEAPYAAKVAEQLGTDHREHYVTDDDLLELVPRLPTIGGVPFADPSLLPTLLVAMLARRDVTVALSGDGADELFAGYNRYAVSQRLERIPSALRRLTAAGIRPLDFPAALPWLERAAGGDQIPGRQKFDLTSTRLRILRAALVGRTPEERYEHLLRAPRALSLMDHSLRSDAVRDSFEQPHHPFPSHLDRMLLMDLEGYLPDDILVKVDRAAMHVSLETRMPFLDHRLVELAWSLPERMLVRDGVTKWVLRRILVRHVDPSLTERPKAGFGVPLGSWLRGTLRPWAEQLLSPACIQQFGLLEVVAVRRLWAEHVTGIVDRSRELWPVLMLQGWLEAVGSDRFGGFELPAHAGIRGVPRS